MKHYQELSVDHFLGKSEEEILSSLIRPTLVKIPGKSSDKAVLVSVLLHGCEPCGFRAMLREIQEDAEYAHDVYFFIGDVEAANLEPRYSKRIVPGKQNFNRVWVQNPQTQREKIAQEVLDKFARIPLIAHLDIHSFTSDENPTHGFIPNKDPKTIALAKFLLPAALVIDHEMGAMIQRTSKQCPAVCVECGTNRSPEADIFAWETLQKFFAATETKRGGFNEILQGVYGNMTNIKVAQHASVEWSDKPNGAHITFVSDITSWNLKEIPRGTLIGWANDLKCLHAMAHGQVVDTKDFLMIKDGQILTAKTVVPNLLARNEFISKESGFYFFEP